MLVARARPMTGPQKSLQDAARPMQKILLIFRAAREVPSAGFTKPLRHIEQKLLFDGDEKTQEAMLMS